MTAKKKVALIALFIIISAIIIVICVGYINKRPEEYDGTLVRLCNELYLT